MLSSQALRGLRSRQASKNFASSGRVVPVVLCMLPNPSLERDLRRQGAWPAHQPVSSSVARAKRLPGYGPSAQTLGPAVTPRVPLRRLDPPAHAQRKRQCRFSTAGGHSDGPNDDQRRFAASANVGQSVGADPANPSSSSRARPSHWRAFAKERRRREPDRRHRHASRLGAGCPLEPPSAARQAWRCVRCSGSPSCLRPRAACLTGRSSGPPPARRLGREALRSIMRLAAQAPCRWRPLSSNVRRHEQPHPLATMSYKSAAVESLLAADPSGRLRALHDQLVALDLKTKMSSNTDTLLFEAVTSTKERVGVAAIRGGNTEVLSFPRPYWVRHAAELDASLAGVEPRHFVEPEGFVSSSQYSLRQVRVSTDTLSILHAVIAGLVRRHAQSLQTDA
jgi:hypothetical protein